MAAGFYVYEHIRKDSNLPFYVGKGKGNRAYVTQHKTQYWKNIVAKHGYEVKIIAKDLDEDLSFIVEVERIDQLRRINLNLVNLTDGGEGMSGYKFTKEAALKRAEKLRGRKRPDISSRMKGVKKSPEHRANLALAKMGVKASVEARLKMSNSRKGRVSAMLGKNHSVEAKQKISESVNKAYADGLVAEKISQKIKSLYESNDYRNKVASATKLALSNPEVRKKMSDSHKGEKNYLYGKRPPQEKIDRQRATLLARPNLICPHCAKSTNEGNAKRWHFDRCKGKN